MFMLPQNMPPRVIRTIRLLREQEAPSIVPQQMVREVECEGEPPFEAVGNSSIC